MLLLYLITAGTAVTQNDLQQAFNANSTSTGITDRHSLKVEPNGAIQDIGYPEQSLDLRSSNTLGSSTITDVNNLTINTGQLEKSVAKEPRLTPEMPASKQRAAPLPEKDPVRQGSVLRRDNGTQSTSFKPVSIKATKDATPKEVAQLNLQFPQDSSPSRETTTLSHSHKKPVHKSRHLEAKGTQLSLFDMGMNDSSFVQESPNGINQSSPTSKTEPVLQAPSAKEQTQPIAQEPARNSSPSIVRDEPQSNREVNQSTGVSVDKASSSRNLTPRQENSVDSSSKVGGMSESLATPIQVFQQLVDPADKRTGDFLALPESSSPSFDTLRGWYRAARELDKSQNYLNRITSVANEFKQGQPLSDKAFAVMQADLQAHKQQTVTEQLNQLKDRDFLQLHQNVSNYFKAAPPEPPSQADKQLVQSQIDKLSNEIVKLWANQASQVALVESMQKNPFRIFNQKYEAALTQVEQTTGLISQSISQKEQKENQLKQWDKQEKVHQAWEKSSQTVEMRDFASLLNSPQMQQRLANINQKLQQQQQVPSPKPAQSRQPQQGDRAKGFSL